MTIRPAQRQNTPLIIGLAGPTKAGKTFSALRLATGLQGDGPIVMLNAEGPRGHQYADTFQYLSGEIEAPFRPEKYITGMRQAMAVQPSVLIIDSVSHMHDAPGGILHWHEEILDRMAGDDQKKRERATFSAWVQPKAAENEFIYAMLELRIPVILCMRAKEKLRLRKGKDPEFFWGPIVGERVAFETLFTLIFPPHARGVPDLAISDMREPFDTMVSETGPVDEALGRRLADWARGSSSSPDPVVPGGVPYEEIQKRHPTIPLPPGESEPRPVRTPVDDAVDELDNVKTIAQRKALWARLTVGESALMNSLIAEEQKRLLTHNVQAQKRVGG
jgi:hypothetical protein